MKTTWTTKSGKQIELETTVVGKTHRDMIHTEYNLVINGTTVNVTRPAVVKGQDCLEFVFVGTIAKNLLPIDRQIAATIAAELKAVKDAVVHVDVTPDAYDRHHEMMTRLMDGEHSDH